MLSDHRRHGHLLHQRNCKCVAVSFSGFWKPRRLCKRELCKLFNESNVVKRKVRYSHSIKAPKKLLDSRLEWWRSRCTAIEVGRLMEWRRILEFWECGGIEGGCFWALPIAWSSQDSTCAVGSGLLLFVYYEAVNSYNLSEVFHLHLLFARTIVY